MRRANTLGAIVVLAAGLGGTPGQAQVQAEAEVGFFSSYVWRGVTYTNNFVVQPDLSLTVPVRRMSLTGGVWANIEPARYDGFSDISESGGLDNFDLAEIDWYGEMNLPLSARTTVVLGATGYYFPNEDGLTPTSNSVELYGRAEWTGPLHPTASIYYDVGKVHGGYVEAGVSHPVTVSERASLTFGALAGVSHGQDAQFDGTDEAHAASYNFYENGFTHADLWTSAELTAGNVTIEPAVHLIMTGDGATKISKFVRDPASDEPIPNETGTKLWLGVTLGWAR